jgi:hypothetical protein
MFAYDIVEETGREAVVLASFSMPWSASVPVFNAAARAYFAALQAEAGRALYLYATLEADDEPNRLGVQRPLGRRPGGLQRRDQVRALARRGLQVAPALETVATPDP